MQNPIFTAIGNVNADKEEEVCFSNESLEVAIEEANGLWNFFHGSDEYRRELDQVCVHQYPNRSILCRAKL